MCPLLVVRLERNLVWRRKITHVHTDHVTTVLTIKNSTWTPAIVKMVLSLHLGLGSSEMDDFWCADANFDPKIPRMVTWQIAKYSLDDSPKEKHETLSSPVYYAALLPRRGRILRRTLSVCLSVCLSVRPVIAIGNVFSSTASVTDVLPR